MEVCKVRIIVWRLFAKHQTLSSQCWIFSSWSRSHKIRFLSILLLSILHTFQSIPNYWWKFYSDRTRKTFPFKAIKKYRYGLWKTVSKHLNNNYCFQASQGDIKIKVWKVWILTDCRGEYCVVQKESSEHKTREWGMDRSSLGTASNSLPRKARTTIVKNC